MFGSFLHWANNNEKRNISINYTLKENAFWGWRMYYVWFFSSASREDLQAIDKYPREDKMMCMKPRWRIEWRLPREHKFEIRNKLNYKDGRNKIWARVKNLMLQIKEAKKANINKVSDNRINPRIFPKYQTIFIYISSWCIAHYPQFHPSVQLKRLSIAGNFNLSEISWLSEGNHSVSCSLG